MLLVSLDYSQGSYLIQLPVIQMTDGKVRNIQV